MRHLSDAQRRARLARRHALAPGHRADDVLSATKAMTALHSTEPATVYLSLHARVDGLMVADVEETLYADRAVVKQLAMRRTLFAFPRDLLPAALGSAAARVAGQQRRQLAKEVEGYGIAPDGAAWLDRACAAVLAYLKRGPASAQQLRAALPELAGATVEVPVGVANPAYPSRVLTVLGAEGKVMRAENTGHWRTSRPKWVLTEDWLDEVPAPLPAEEGYAELIRRWLRTFGPGTETDIVWWLGATKGAARKALADIGAEQVGLDGGTGWVLAEDDDDGEPVEPWAALLPVLDPTVMGWKERDFYLGPHAPHVFDSNGNAGSTAWWDGRIVGCWVQDAAGVVGVGLVGDVPAAGREALDHEAERLTAWLDGVRVGTVYPSPAMKTGAPR